MGARARKLGRVTLKQQYDSSFLQALREVSPPQANDDPQINSLEPLCRWLRDIEALVERVQEWTVESAFMDSLGTVLPHLEKDIGLTVLRLLGSSDALDRLMWTPVNASPRSETRVRHDPRREE